MRFKDTSLSGAYVIDPEPMGDDRGLFVRVWCAREFADHHLSSNLAQVNLSYTRCKGTLRGMHYQEAPYEEVKVVRCVRGCLHDVIIDLRKDSPTYRMTFAVELTAANGKSLYVPAGVAHGFQTLDDDTEVLYLVSAFHTPGAERGVRHDDPAFSIAWPLAVRSISDKDAGWPDFRD
jgi:dTDP-4-dehydrorhamnose 3,5-epimerase